MGECPAEVCALEEVRLSKVAETGPKGVDEGSSETTKGSTVSMWVPKDEVQIEVHDHENSSDVGLLILGALLPGKGQKVFIDDLGAGTA